LVVSDRILKVDLQFPHFLNPHHLRLNNNFPNPPSKVSTLITTMATHKVFEAVFLIPSPSFLSQSNLCNLRHHKTLDWKVCYLR
jgi:hypothetical protein